MMAVLGFIHGNPLNIAGDNYLTHIALLFSSIDVHGHLLHDRSAEVYKSTVRLHSAPTGGNVPGYRKIDQHAVSVVKSG